MKRGYHRSAAAAVRCVGIASHHKKQWSSSGAAVERQLVVIVPSQRPDLRGVHILSLAGRCGTGAHSGSHGVTTQ
jgi:hypothetical protein